MYYELVKELDKQLAETEYSEETFSEPQNEEWR